MVLFFSDGVALLFFIVLTFYALLIVLFTDFQYKRKGFPHHYQVGFLILFASIISLGFILVFGNRDFFTGIFWSSLLAGCFSILIDFKDFEKDLGKRV